MGDGLKAIVFDFDGILVDSEPLHFQAIRDVGRSLGADFDYAYYLERMVGFDDREAFEHLLRDVAGHGGAGGGDGADVTPARIAALCQQKQDAFEELVKRGIEPLPGAVELVSVAAGQMPIAIATGAVLRDVTVVLEQLAWRNVFEVIVSADEVARSKPDPQTYALAVQRLAARHPGLALTPGTSLAIEDTAAGLASARAAGLRTLGVTTTMAADQLADAERVVDSLAEVTLEALDAWFG